MCPNESLKFSRIPDNSRETEGHKIGRSVHELKHTVKLQEWSVRIAECRSSGIGVNAWCMAHDIALKNIYNWRRQIVKAVT